MEPSFRKSTPPSANNIFSGDLYGSSSLLRRELPEPDLLVRTSGGLRIPVHSSVLASVSPVLESIIDQPRKHRSSKRIIPILGVPCDAVAAFIGFLYSSRFDVLFMACLAHQVLRRANGEVWDSPFGSIPCILSAHLKQRCTKGLGQGLTIENVVDVLQLARLCDAPDLYLKCMKLVYSNFKSVENTEGWKFMSYHDPRLELEILQFIDEKEQRKKKARRYREEQRVYLELSEATECLEHIFTEGCTTVGPHDTGVNRKREPCSKFATCQSLQILIRHFAGCKNRVNRGCSRCKSMWQLLRLHSSICDHPDSCRVPLCREYKWRLQREETAKKKKMRREDTRWKVLVEKVMAAKLMSSLSQSKRKRDEHAVDKIGDHGIRSFRLKS